MPAPRRAPSAANRSVVTGGHDSLEANAKQLRRRRTLERIGVALSYALFGLLAGSLGTVVHRQRFVLGDATIWHGVALALLAVTLTALGLRWYLRDRLASFAFAVGVLIAVQLLALPGIGESVIIPASATGSIGVGEIWSVAGPVIAFLPAIWPDLRTARAESHTDDRARYAETQRRASAPSTPGHAQPYDSTVHEENRP